MLRIYVGNLSFNTSEDELKELFSQHGTVDNASIITDRMTGRSRGFGFVSMPNDAEAREAMSALDGYDLGGRKLRVNEARERDDRPAGRR